MIIENRVIWSPANNRWRLDEEPRWPLDNLMHTVYMCAAVEILVPPSRYLKERPPLRFYDPAVKAGILNKQVTPVLQAVFAPKGSRSPPDKPWEVDNKGRLILLWSALEEFLVNLLWCSKLQSPFVFDLDRLLTLIKYVRDDLLRGGALDDPRLLNDLIALMSLYQRHETWCLVPSDSGRGSALQIWHQLRTEALYKKLSHGTRRLGLHRRRTIEAHLGTLRLFASRLAESKAFVQTISLTKRGVSLFLGPQGRFASEALSRVAGIVFGKRYVPPVYALTEIERSFDEVFYPQRVKEKRRESENS